jgi:5-oxoprolinase (ATP-hydrolysing)
VQERGWEFWIDVGGTFTDCVGRSHDGTIRVAKVLSSGVVKTAVTCVHGEALSLELPAVPAGFFRGYTLWALADDGGRRERFTVRDSAASSLVLDRPWSPEPAPGARAELTASEPAPVLAMRLLLGRGLDEPLGPVDVRLGTTRGTNALLERRGVRTALVTTSGFADVLRIANQDRPKLFALRVVKPVPLHEAVLELPERVAADGRVLAPLDREAVRRGLDRLRRDGIEAVAICLLNAYRSSCHEEQVAEEAERAGFARVSVSSRLAPTIKIVSRGETTVLDAYLTPVVQRDLSAIRERIPAGRLALMTSAGGLVEPGSFTGKDTVLSGPAGGAVATAGFARDAGIERAIGFDMGGTSTDVSRWAGRLVHEYETVKAGVRVVAPVLAIETVAAGGGSLCRFDGHKLTVGPQSAGADPGPACYGRGGPLALTDLNVFLGRLRDEDFPFRLDREAVAARLAQQRREISAALGRDLDAVGIAEGYIRIANAGMAAAIERITVARGHDVRDYTIVAFGGAAGQHACAVARGLGVGRVLVHSHASVFSAWGMGQADVRKFAVRTLLADCASLDPAALEALFGEMEAELEGEMRRAGAVAARIIAIRRLDLRYRGQSSTITVPATEQGDWPGEFERRHRRLYGHAFEGRPLEVVAARVELVGEMKKARAPAVAEATREATARDTAEVVFEGRRRPVPVHRRDDLRAGHALEGPALVVEPTTTTVLEPGWRCRVLTHGELELEDVAGRPVGRPVAACAPDPVLLEVFHNRFAAIAEQMGETLKRTSLSVNVKERLDYSCAVFTAEGDLVANAPHMPVHLGAMGETIKHVLHDLPELGPGDVVATNDPFRGGSHLPDVTVVTPVFDADGARLFFTASRAHHAEIGGTRPGSMPPDSTNLAQEGVLIRNLKVVERGRPRLDALRELLVRGAFPSRSPDENVADVGAQIASNQTGARALEALCTEYGVAGVQVYMRHIQRTSEAKLGASLDRLGPCRRTFEDRLDDGTPIRVRLEIADGRAKLDFTGSGVVSPTNLNANPAIVKAAILYCFRCLIDEEIPLNAGVLAPLEIVLPAGLLNPPGDDDPARCPAVVGGNVETSQRVTDVLLGALGLVAASQGTMNNVTFGNDRFGYYETICGGTGAGPDFDGADAVHSHMTNTRLTDPEVLEARYPVRLVRFAIRRGSGGAGRRRGGDGAVREIEFLAPLELSILSQRRTTRPYGVDGGEPGAAGRNTLVRASGTVEDLGPVASVRVLPGDRLIVETPGGGGWGAPSGSRLSG